MDLGLRDYNGHDKNRIDRFDSIQGVNGFGEKDVDKMLLVFCDERELCVVNTWF